MEFGRLELGNILLYYSNSFLQALLVEYNNVCCRVVKVSIKQQ